MGERLADVGRRDEGLSGPLLKNKAVALTLNLMQEAPVAVWLWARKDEAI